MPKVAKELSALEIKRLEHPGKGINHTVAVGGVAGLMLQITPNSGKTWLLRTVVGAKRREFGLGGYPEVSLAAARDRARELKGRIREGIDPTEERKAHKAALIAAQRRGMTFEDAVEKYLSAKLDQYKNPKHRQQWRNTLHTYAMPELGSMLVQDIVVQDVLRVLQPIWLERTETASRLRGRIEAVLSWATVSGHRSGDNPARWAGNLKELLPAPSRVAKEENHPALQLSDVQRWVVGLRSMEGMGRLALEFALLTAARSQEVRGARWDEVDFEKSLWVIPAERMKRAREHRVPLSDVAMRHLASTPRFEGSDLIFPAPRGGMLSDMTLSAAMKRLHEADLKEGGAGYSDRVSGRSAVPHGLRSTFRDWVAECTGFPGDMAEVALAHKVSNAVEAAYRRGDMIKKRRAMMQAWAEFVDGRILAANVVSLVGSVER
ncbi:tyrosine-type recombinase/integrase [Pseudooceanicola sp. 200-1SW]|uniref:tyrosine-type recombinase/integrase n=1 Tax=Pseudooceanicola sp. 200-1SW TaxID=3425949 RepID=UPI003D7FEC48